jgi:hypothetical protein
MRDFTHLHTVNACCLMQNGKIFSHIMTRAHGFFLRDDDFCNNQHAELDIYSASSLK